MIFESTARAGDTSTMMYWNLDHRDSLSGKWFNKWHEFDQLLQKLTRTRTPPNGTKKSMTKTTNSYSDNQTLRNDRHTGLGQDRLVDITRLWIPFYQTVRRASASLNSSTSCNCTEALEGDWRRTHHLLTIRKDLLELHLDQRETIIKETFWYREIGLQILVLTLRGTIKQCQKQARY